jgi:hypothetical protein
LDSKWTKRIDTNEEILNWPPKEYTHFARPIAMKYYMYKYLRMLEHEFLDNSMDRYVELCKDLCRQFMHKFDASKKFNNYADFWDHVKWLDYIVTTNTTNIIKGTFEVL